MLQILQRKTALQALYIYTNVINRWVSRTTKKAMQAVQKEDLTNIYTSLTGLPLNKWIDYFVDGDLFALTIDRNAPVDPLALAKTASDLYTQYVDAIGGKDAQVQIKLIGTIYKLQSKVERINNICLLLELEYDEQLAKDLKDLGIRRKISKETLIDDLRAIEVEIKRFVLDLEKHTDALNKKPKNAEKPTRNQFYDVLMSYDAKVLPESIDTYMYCRIYNSLVEKAKAAELQHGRRKNK
jgi:hypothetical protein